MRVRESIGGGESGGASIGVAPIAAMFFLQAIVAKRDNVSLRHIWHIRGPYRGVPSAVRLARRLGYGLDTIRGDVE